jgi:hypothetical protein
LKKRTKKLLHIGARVATGADRRIKSFLLLFSKKKSLLNLASLRFERRERRNTDDIRQKARKRPPDSGGSAAAAAGGGATAVSASYR